VGSHVLRELLERGERVVVLDDLSEGHEAAAAGAEIVRANLSEPAVAEALDELFSREPFEAVMHFGAKAYVGESVTNPEKYYRNNVTGGVNLLAAMSRHGVSAMVFSSTCSTYGVPIRVPIAEDHPQNPINAYGRTKLAFERALVDFEVAFGIRHVSLRYFNAAGAHESGELGEDHRPETHLIPLACEAALNRGSVLSIFGDDYETPDGTCVRDYVHVQDLATAHVLALQRLREGGSSTAYNLGTGRGHSVLEVVETVERVSGRDVPREITLRRPGDPPRLVASSDKIRDELGWTPRFTELQSIVETAWRFKERFPDGYEEH
jgi:UDP-glucose 4-epimerase